MGIRSALLAGWPCSGACWARAAAVHSICAHLKSSKLHEENVQYTPLLHGRSRGEGWQGVISCRLAGLVLTVQLQATAP